MARDEGRLHTATRKRELDINDKNITSLWITKIAKSFDLKRKRPKDRNLITFLARLAATPRNSVPGFKSNESIRELHSSVTSLSWIGINTILGTIGKEIKPTCFDREIILISTLGQSIISSSLEIFKTAFHKDKILIKES